MMTTVKPVTYRQYYWKELKRHLRAVFRDLRGVILNRKM
jgi:hypothetical protein